MPKDYKDAPAPRAESRLNHPLLLGMIIGLLLGIVISLAVALWLNRLSNPFVEKGKQVEPISKIAPPQSQPPAEAAKAAEAAARGKAPPPEKPTAKATEKASDKPASDKPAAKSSERPRFEFYQILPGEKEGADKDAKPAPKTPPPQAPSPSVAAKPGSNPSTPKAFSGEQYWLQAGAFSEEREADNLKAKIALSGLEATVRTVTTADKGTLYRVRLGPYQSLDVANRIKSSLSQNGVGAAIIRTTEEPR
jgi:cell division protein FtsN